MVQGDDSTRVITDAEGLIAAREFPTALERLRIAAETVPTDHADAAALFLRIRAAAVAVARTDPRQASEAQAVWDIAVRRDALMGEHTERLAGTSPLAVAGSGGWPEEEPWFFGAAEVVAEIAIVGSVSASSAGSSSASWCPSTRSSARSGPKRRAITRVSSRTGSRSECSPRRRG